MQIAAHHDVPGVAFQHFAKDLLGRISMVNNHNFGLAFEASSASCAVAV